MRSVASAFCEIVALPVYAEFPAEPRCRDATAIALAQAGDGRRMVPIRSDRGAIADISATVTEPVLLQH
jgi:hypothetical protein